MGLHPGGGYTPDRRTYGPHAAIARAGPQSPAGRVPASGTRHRDSRRQSASRRDWPGRSPAPAPAPPAAAISGSRERRPVQSRSATALSARSEEHTSELQSLMRISYAVFCLKKKKKNHYKINRYKDKTS